MSIIYHGIVTVMFCFVFIVNHDTQSLIFEYTNCKFSQISPKLLLKCENKILQLITVSSVIMLYSLQRYLGKC